MRIVHIVNRDKFTVGYINFMKKMSGYDHIFFIHKEGWELHLESDENIFFVSTYNDLSKKIYNMYLKDADLIIISGFFFWKEMYPFIRHSIFKKTYIHLWGGDFYCLKSNKSFKERVINRIKKYLLSNAGGVINLISNDYIELCKYCTPKGKHFLAPMCGDGTAQELVSSLRLSEKSRNPISIIVGNSATETNQHFDILKGLSRFKDENIEIVCPLSYGCTEYADSVIQFGTKIFGNKFVPLLKYMDKKMYYEYIAKSCVAVFNNNRQQAMGNINAALGLGCKVYIRSDAPMWEEYYKKRKYEVFKVEDIDSMTFDEFVRISDEQIAANQKRYIKSSDYNVFVKQWTDVFESMRCIDEFE